MKDNLRALINYGILSRLIILVVTICIISPLVKSAHSIHSWNYVEETLQDKILYYLRGFLTWDADHFEQISQNGYIFDKNYAFFPFMPLMHRMFNMLGTVIVPNLKEAFALISCIAISNFAFLLSVICFFKFSNKILNNEKLAYNASIFYIFNPASFYFSGYFTESMFTCLGFVGIYFIYKTKGCSISNIILGSVFLGLATFTRSNALFLLLFPGHVLLIALFSSTNIKYILQIIMSGLLCLSIVLSIFIFCMYYLPYARFCIEENKNSSYPEWCYNNPPSVYSHIQHKFWDVGFLSSFTTRVNKNQFIIYSLPFNILGGIALISIFITYFKEILTLGVRNYKHKKSTGRELIVPFFINLLITYLTVLLLANCEINTRLCASCPLVYWFYGALQAHVQDKNIHYERIKANVDKENSTISADFVIGIRSNSLFGKGILIGWKIYSIVYFCLELFLVPTFIGWV